MHDALAGSEHGYHIDIKERLKVGHAKGIDGLMRGMNSLSNTVNDDANDTHTIQINVLHC